MSPARRPVAVLAACLLLAGCSEALSISETLAASGDHRAAWEAAGLRDYRYEYRRSCECAPETTRPVEIEVRDGAVRSVTLVETGEPLSSGLAWTFPTVDDLFDLIDDAVRRNADLLEVTYDPTFGYPTTLRIDYRREVADDEMEMEASNLRPL